MADKHQMQLKDFDKRSDEYLKIAAKSATSGSVLIGLKAIGKAKRKAPVRTGNLRASGFVVTDTQIPEHGGKFKRGRAIGKGSVKKLTAKLEENVARHEALKSRTKSNVEKRSTNIRKVGAVGFSAIYAMAVHENPRAGASGAEANTPEIRQRGKRKGTKLPVQYIHSKVGENKFLESTMREMKPIIPKILKHETKKQLAAFSKPMRKES